MWCRGVIMLYFTLMPTFIETRLKTANSSFPCSCLLFTVKVWSSATSDESSFINLTAGHRVTYTDKCWLMLTHGLCILLQIYFSWCVLATFPASLHWSPEWEAVGGPMAAKHHSLTPVPSPTFPSLCKPGALPNSLFKHSAQPRGAATQKKSLNQLWREEGGRERGGRKRPGNFVDQEIGKQWQNPLRQLSCDWKKSLFLGSGEGERTRFQGCSSWSEASWAHGRRTGKYPLFSFL